MTFGIQTCGSHESMTDEFTFSMCFGDGPALTFEGLTRDQVMNMRDCLDAMLWHEQDSDYESVLDDVRATIGPYVSVLTEEEAAQEVLETIRELLLRKVEFSDDSLDGTLHWPDVERMITRPLDQ
jgi:succinate dehydrogenase/fumarate reductase flavoprotein subunit